MSKLILCTIGTSIANGCPSLRKMQGHLSHWDDEESDFETEVMEKITGLDYRNNSGVRRKLSAELNTLDRMGLEGGDKVVLLATDSLAGRVCSEALSSVIEEIWQAEVKIERIDGMQVYDAKRLREEGLKNLVKRVLEYLDDDTVRYSYDDIIINPTGGYKAIVPFLTVLGMLYGRKAIYLFEHSDELIELPPLPLTFDLQLFERVKGALKFIEKEVAVSPEAYFSRIVGYDPAERDLFLSFTEPMDEKTITLSPLAYVLIKIEESGETCMVSDEVKQTLLGLKGEKKEIIERMIDNCANPLWRHQKMHRWPNSKILIIKPGNTAERLAGYMKSGTFYISLAFESHDSYEKELSKYTLEQLQQMTYTSWETRTVTDTVMNFPAVTLSDEERRELMNEIDRLKSKLAELEEERLEPDSDLLEQNIGLEEAFKASEKEKRILLAKLEELQKEQEKMIDINRHESEKLREHLRKQIKENEEERHIAEKKIETLKDSMVSVMKKLTEKKQELKFSLKALKKEKKKLTEQKERCNTTQEQIEHMLVRLKDEKRKKKALKRELQKQKKQWKKVKKRYRQQKKHLKLRLEKMEKRLLRIEKKKKLKKEKS